MCCTKPRRKKKSIFPFSTSAHCCGLFWCVSGLEPGRRHIFWMHPSLCHILDSTDVGRTTIEIIWSMIPLHGSKELQKGYSAIWCPSLAPCRSHSQPRYPANMQSLAGHYASSFVDICSKRLKYWSTHPVHLSLSLSPSPSLSLSVSLFTWVPKETKRHTVDCCNLGSR